MIVIQICIAITNQNLIVRTKVSTRWKDVKALLNNHEIKDNVQKLST